MLSNYAFKWSDVRGLERRADAGAGEEEPK